MIFKGKKKLDESPEAEPKEVEAPVHANPDLRIVGLYGELEENRAASVISVLLDLAEDSEAEIKENPESEELTKVNLPIEFLISTPGGSADDMFAIYDVMRVVRERCPISTYGLGKVMSAGVLILAAGTKGTRRIGKHCRVMIHSVIAGSAGSFHNLQNEMSEIKFMQTAYIKALAAETNMTEAKLRRMMNKKVNIYLSAEEAVELGIADIIV
jgi:ATP-dependent Clp endopeptidase proteolytic subunit ClpP